MELFVYVENEYVVIDCQMGYREAGVHGFLDEWNVDLVDVDLCLYCCMDYILAITDLGEQKWGCLFMWK